MLLCAFAGNFSSQVIHYTPDSIFDQINIEINQKSKFFIHQTQVCSQLLWVNRRDRLHGLYLNYNFVVYD